MSHQSADFVTRHSKRIHTRTQPDPTNETAIYFASFNPDTISGPLAQSQIITVNDAPGTQMQPAFDNDDIGDILLTYYTTENHLPDNRYQLYGIGLSATGQVLPGCGPTPIDVNAYVNTFLGDYHENYFFTFPTLGSLWNTSWARNLPEEDAVVSGVR